MLLLLMHCCHVCVFLHERERDGVREIVEKDRLCRQIEIQIDRQRKGDRDRGTKIDKDTERDKET